MGKVKELLDDSEFTCPFGTEDEGVASIWIKDLNELDKELDIRLEAIQLLQKRMTQILIDNELEHLYDVVDTICVCDDCLEEARDNEKITSN